MALTGRQVLVTGAGGFIGSHLTEALLAEGAKVRALVHYNSAGSWGLLEGMRNNSLEVVAGDICDPYFCQTLVKGQEIVFHLAALIAIPYSYVAPQSYFQTNVLGTINLLQAARDQGVFRFVHTSTSETYGTAQYVPIDEKHPLQGQSPYSASKIAADKAAESYYCAFGLPVTIVRPFNTYGPRQSARAFIPTVICQALSEETRAIKLGSLKPVRDLTFVKDTAAGYLVAATHKKLIGETVNLGVGHGYSIGEVAKLITDLIGTDKKIVTDMQRIRPGKSEVWKLVSNNQKMKSLTGWQPRTSLKCGLKQTIKWIEQNLAQYKPEIYNL